MQAKIRITVDVAKAVRDIAHYSRSILRAEAAERIANAFGYTLGELSIDPFLYEEGTDWGDRSSIWEGGYGTATSTVAWRLASKLSPGWDADRPPSPYIGAGRNADYATFGALDAIKQAIDFPPMYVREKLGPDKEAPSGGHYLGSGETLGWELIHYEGEDFREVLETHDTEDAAYEALVRWTEEMAITEDAELPDGMDASEGFGYWPGEDN